MSRKFEDGPESEIFDEWPAVEHSSSYRGVSIRSLPGQPPI
jgi:hypothetical protein